MMGPEWDWGHWRRSWGVLPEEVAAECNREASHVTLWSVQAECPASIEANNSPLLWGLNELIRDEGLEQGLASKNASCFAFVKESVRIHQGAGAGMTSCMGSPAFRELTPDPSAATPSVCCADHLPLTYWLPSSQSPPHSLTGWAWGGGRKSAFSTSLFQLILRPTKGWGPWSCWMDYGQPEVPFSTAHITAWRISNCPLQGGQQHTGELCR